MKKKRMRIIVISVILIFIAFLYFVYSDYSSLGCYFCGVYAVPGTYHSDLKGMEASYEILEEDDYGRVLFFYTAPDFISKQQGEYIVICQKITDKYVYFYEDICFEILYDDEDADIQELKKKNDWNSPLDESKMAFREMRATFDNVIIDSSELNYQEIRRLCWETLDIYQPQIVELCIDDAQPDGTAIYYLEVRVKTAKERYFVRVDKDYNISFYKIPGERFEVTEEYLKFKNPDKS